MNLRYEEQYKIQGLALYPSPCSVERFTLGIRLFLEIGSRPRDPQILASIHLSDGGGLQILSDDSYVGRIWGPGVSATALSKSKVESKESHKKARQDEASEGSDERVDPLAQLKGLADIRRSK